ncbi:hypothetical protein JHK86_026500 [Glycine max]|nr:hypothetical protein JHK86_026500 [Glycine max]
MNEIDGGGCVDQRAEQATRLEDLNASDIIDVKATECDDLVANIDRDAEDAGVVEGGDTEREVIMEEEGEEEDLGGPKAHGLDHRVRFSTRRWGPEQTIATTVASLFFYDNPFQRKPTPFFESTNHTQNPNDGDHPMNIDFGKEKKWKRNKDKTNKTPTPTINTLVFVTEAIEKSEKKRKRDSDEGKNLNVDTKAIGKRKRKRDEVEKDWEEECFSELKSVLEDEG